MAKICKTCESNGSHTSLIETFDLGFLLDNCEWRHISSSTLLKVGHYLKKTNLLAEFHCQNILHILAPALTNAILPRFN